jgi:hypothetical protein
LHSYLVASPVYIFIQAHAGAAAASAVAAGDQFSKMLFGSDPGSAAASASAAAIDAAKASQQADRLAGISPAGTHFPRFIGTQVQILTHCSKKSSFCCCCYIKQLRCSR